MVEHLVKIFKSVIIVRNFGTKNSFTKNLFFEKKKNPYELQFEKCTFCLVLKRQSS